MDIFTVSLFGHREIEDLRDLENRLVPIIRDIIASHSYVSFFIGREGEFCEFAASVIKRVQREFEKGRSEIILVLPYTVANIEYYERYYDGIIIPDDIFGIHYKAVIEMKNRWMLEKSDLAIFFVEREFGGAYAAMKYAERIGKRMINLVEK